MRNNSYLVNCNAVKMLILVVQIFLAYIISLMTSQTSNPRPTINVSCSSQNFHLTYFNNAIKINLETMTANFTKYQFRSI